MTSCRRIVVVVVEMWLWFWLLSRDLGKRKGKKIEWQQKAFGSQPIPYVGVS